MKHIMTLRIGDKITETYFCKTKNSAITKAGKPFDNLILQDRTGLLDGKIWEPTSAGIDDYDSGDYVAVTGQITEFNGALQLNISRVRRVDPSEVDPSEYMPKSDYNIDDMYSQLLTFVDKVSNPHYKRLLSHFFTDDAELARAFKYHSAAKTVHHSFIGGLLEHTLSVTRVCDFFCKNYPFLKKDLLITSALLHDIGKLRELQSFPVNDYSDEGNLIGHIVVGVEMVDEAIRQIDAPLEEASEKFPDTLALELKHCIVSHHGSLEFGSPKKPALAEALALSFADNLDAKMETMKEALSIVEDNSLEWQKRNFFLDTIVRRTSKN